MTLSDRALDHLRRVMGVPDLSNPRYEILGEVARGGMGTVYLAMDRDLKRHVALKVLTAIELGREGSERMVREAQILARLEHPGIVPVHDVGRSPDGLVYYAMKLVEGDRLDEHVRARGLPERLRIFGRICDAVAFAHAHGVIHRDLKPSNVMVGPFGEVLVMDWGVAKILTEAPPEGPDVSQKAHVADSRALDTDETPAAPAGYVPGATRPGMVLGTPGYMSPEQAAGRVDLVDARSDIYALGVILGELVAGVDERVPPRLAAILRKAIDEQPEKRYEKVTELQSDVSRFLDGESVAAYREGPFEILGRWFQRYRGPILLVLAYLVVRALIFIFAGT